MLTHWKVILYLLLFCTKWFHCSSQKIGHKRVMLFTNNDNPHADNPSLQVRIPFIYLNLKRVKLIWRLLNFSHLKCLRIALIWGQQLKFASWMLQRIIIIIIVIFIIIIIIIINDSIIAIFCIKITELISFDFN